MPPHFQCDSSYPNTTFLKDIAHSDNRQERYWYYGRDTGTGYFHFAKFFHTIIKYYEMFEGQEK